MHHETKPLPLVAESSVLHVASVGSTAEPTAVARIRKRLEGQAVAPFDLEMPDGRVFRVSATAARPGAAPAFRVRLRTPKGEAAFAKLDEYGIARAYMDGDIDVEGDFLSVLDLRPCFTDRHPVSSMWRFLRPLFFGRTESDKAWVPKHYDYGNDFYFAFLDKRHRLYSQALFREGTEAIEEAAQNKLDYVAEACRLQPGSRVLDVGAGWGSFAGFAASRGADVTMMTISHEQFKFLDGWARGSNRPGAIRAVYENIYDYVADERYDAIVLLGVMEHLPRYRRLFECFQRLMKPGGRLYMDFAANRTKYSVSTFTYRHVFPGSHTPVVVPRLLEAANRTRFEPVAIHNDRHSYYLTLAAWARNLEAQAARLCEQFGEPTYRLFQMYLWGGAHLMCRAGELESYRMVFQLSMGDASEKVGLAAG